MTEERKSPLAFLTESLPDFKVGEEYQASVQATGGTPPYTFETTDGSWPYGISMSDQGEVTGVPSEGEDTTVFVTVTDNDGAHETQAFDCQI